MADDKEARKVLLGQAKALGLVVDGRWSVETLAEKVLEAQETLTEASAKAIKDASDTEVFLLRDAFPVADERHRAGETITVPAEMARHWYRVGVARPAD